MVFSLAEVFVFLTFFNINSQVFGIENEYEQMIGDVSQLASSLFLPLASKSTNDLVWSVVSVRVKLLF